MQCKSMVVALRFVQECDGLPGSLPRASRNRVMVGIFFPGLCNQL